LQRSRRGHNSPQIGEYPKCSTVTQHAPVLLILYYIPWLL